MLIKELIEELKRLPEDATIGILNGVYCLDNFRIENTKDKDITFIHTYYKSKYDYFFACNGDRD